MCEVGRETGHDGAFEAKTPDHAGLLNEADTCGTGMRF